jgi:hypothetical protein
MLFAAITADSVLCLPPTPDLMLFARTTPDPPLPAADVSVDPLVTFALVHVPVKLRTVHEDCWPWTMVTPFTVPVRLRLPVIVWVPTKVLEPNVA